MGSKSKLAPRGETTRALLVDTALRVFNDVGYWGTDSNSIAREAGYSPGTFYRHFVDKRAIFLAAYEAWAANELAELDDKLERARGANGDRAGAFVDFMVAHHARWRTLRASTRALAISDPRLERAIREHRRGLLDELMSLIGRRDVTHGLLVLHALDAVCDALADGEARAMGVKPRELAARVRALIAAERAERALSAAGRR
jgi:AcrR family transcriptional regulator